MVTIADLKPIETARHELLKRLMSHPLEDYDLTYADTADERKFNREQLSPLVALRLVDFAYNDNLNQTWYWLTEAGFERLGYQIPEDYTENPFCDNCDGTGKDEDANPDLDEDDECPLCFGEGVDYCEVDEWYYLEDDTN